MEPINKIEYKLVDVPTRSVVLFPARAQIFRDIKDIDLKTGINEVTITGLSPTLDEDSVKVEGTGSAIITDISVVSLPNRDIFNEVYPDDDVSDESDDEDDDPETSAELKQAEARVAEIQDEARLVEDTILSTSKRQQILDLRSESADKSELEKGARLTELLAAYKKEREALCEEGLKAAQAQRHIHEKMNAATSHLHKVQKAALKESRERRRAKEREREIRRMRRGERREEKERIRKERETFWPKYCYSVTITLDVNTMTPISSRRQSIASDIDVVKVAAVKDDGYDGDTFQEGFSCDLTLSYITSAAKWQPSYDLQLSTTSATATLCFDAKISNETSETWKNCKVSLSTSDAAFAGIDSALPELVPWRIRLLGGKSIHYGGQDDQITRSRTERFEHQSYVRERMSRTVDHKSRFDMFGLPYVSGHGGCFPPPPPAVSIGAIPCVKPMPPGAAREASDDNGDTVGGLQNWGGEEETKRRRRMMKKSVDVDYRAAPQAAAVPPPSAAPRLPPTPSIPNIPTVGAKESHPFGQELAQVSELAEEYSAGTQLKPIDEEEELYISSRGLGKFSADDYLGIVQSLTSTFFPDHTPAPAPALWI
ncbi:hypothetical protein NQ176_g5864 [Zarea fungicola]|uniref:Uncharacterized protein n=1 Tax=Zarea fungicola TaxID=93591 RepID=A0ACC1N7M9_9HYPO|nr:hypothetical protein NQ176_g5864 [Lecanicillium fungicola]